VDRNTYEQVKRAAPRTDVNRATRLLYLNRCGYGGIYRTDKYGVFNVPFSGDRSTTSLWDNGRLAGISAALTDAQITCADFADALAKVEAGAVVYCDPVYALPGSNGVFSRYSPHTFTWADQLRLAEVVHDLRRRGACVIVSNSADDRVAALFAGGVSACFDRRMPFPKANGTQMLEALYILADESTERSVARWLESSPRP